MLDLSFIGADNGWDTTEKTKARLTAVRACSVMFWVEGLGVDPTGAKGRIYIYRGSTVGSPGGAVTPQKRDSSHGEATTTLATMLDVFTNEVSYVAGALIDEFTFHNQYHRPSEWYRLNAAETLDVRAKLHAAGTLNAFLKFRVYG